MTAPFLPFTRPSIDAQSIAAVADVFRSGQLASGPKVQAFEAALAAYLGSGRQVRVMTSATAGLEMALEVAGVGEGDEVIVPAMSFAASANVVARVRAKPVFVDIELRSRNIDVALIENCQRQMGDTLLRADRDDRLGVRIEINLVTALVPVADRQAQLVDPARDRVAMVGAFRRGLDELGDDMRRRGLVGIGHAEIDDVLACAAGLETQLADGVEDVGW